MFPFILGIASALLIFILIVFRLYQFSADSDFRSFIDEKYSNKDLSIQDSEVFKREISLPDETINWINSFFSQISSHFRGDYENTDIKSLNEAVTKLLPPGYIFKLDTIGKDVLFEKPKLYYKQVPSSNSKDKLEDKEIFQISIPFIYNGLSFTIFSQIDRKDNANQNFEIPLFEFDFKKIESILFLSFSSDSCLMNDFNLDVALEVEKENSVFDFDSSIIFNGKKITITNCPIFGGFLKEFIKYFIVRRKLDLFINLSKFNFDSLKKIIENQNIVQSKLNLI